MDREGPNPRMGSQSITLNRIHYRRDRVDVLTDAGEKPVKKEEKNNYGETTVVQ
jgi:hypothetical protein